MATPDVSRVTVDDFTYRRITVDGIGINTAIAGSGPPVLLLHGYPQTHLIWRDVAPSLAGQYTVVLADLRGYGDSDKPAPSTGDDNYSKRAMAADQVGVMRQLGFTEFDLVGHDRGARVAHRLALDYPDMVTRLVLLDIVPTRHVLNHVTRNLATAYFHWFFLASGGDIPERLLGRDPGFWIRSVVERLLAPPAVIEPRVIADYVRCFSDPAAIAGSCADYRAAGSVDLIHDDHSAAAGQKITCPTLVLWGEKSFVGKQYEPLQVWQDYATNVVGRSLPAGHFLPEELPEQVLAEITAFLS
jgi:haloacetate dehalogenase